jgi:D-serine deaminase-like pyridoxal phosphate-dependent protein
VIDAGSKTLAADRCGPAPDSGHGCVVELPGAKITRLSEEHGQVDVRNCSGRIPKVGERVTVVPNHICPCVNLQDRVYWKERGEDAVRPLDVDARGRVC